MPPVSQEKLRLRIFAGPNGSGKSTVVDSIKKMKVNGHLIPFGDYINADDTATDIRKGDFTFKKFNLTVHKDALVNFAESSGLLVRNISRKQFDACFALDGQRVVILNIIPLDKLAQVIARFLWQEMLNASRSFSFETVFSHHSTLELMKLARKKGYKVYLYFVSTESVEINKFRVEFRVTQKGHNVASTKIEERYNRSLELMYEAAQLSDSAYFLDNSDETYQVTAQFERSGRKKVWDKKITHKAKWFKKYYSPKWKKKRLEGKTP